MADSWGASWLTPAAPDAWGGLWGRAWVPSWGPAAASDPWAGAWGASSVTPPGPVTDSRSLWSELPR